VDEGYTPYRVYNSMLDQSAGSASYEKVPAVPVIEPGSQEIIVDVTLRYEIK
jgi:hypothetical protein